jgi:hypothetical protein
MNRQSTIEKLRALADRLEKPDTEIVQYLGEDGNIHEIPIDTRVTHIPKEAGSAREIRQEERAWSS